LRRFWRSSRLSLVGGWADRGCDLRNSRKSRVCCSSGPGRWSSSWMICALRVMGDLLGASLL
jgi:hypothetical protein